MQRPMMDPMLLMEDEAPRRRGEKRPLRELLARAIRVGKVLGRVLFANTIHIRRREPDDELPFTTRLLRGVGYRLLFVPIFLALTAAALVYRGTHPLRLASDKLPEVPGSFYETLEFSAPTDGQRLMAWFVPVVDAKRVIEMKNKVFKGKQPAVVLVHDYNASASQMVPLVGPLHGQGFVVLAVGLRGAGRGPAAAQTFGLNEAADVRAALAQLRQRPTVDVEHIAIVGVGTGATAAVIAASQEPGVKALVLIDARETPEQVVADFIGPNRPGFQWLQHASKWAFEMAYHVDAEDLHLARFRTTTESKPTLSLSRGADGRFNKDTLQAITAFCKENLPIDTSTGAVATTTP